MDVRTLIVALGLTHVIQVGVFLQQYRNGKAYPGVGWWLLWSMTAGAGFVCLLLRQIPAIHSAAILLQNLALILSVVFIYVGVQRFFGRHVRVRLVGGLFAGYAAALAFFLFAHDSIVARTVIICAALAATGWVTASALWRSAIPSVTDTAKGNAIVFFVHGAVFAHRGVMVALGQPVDNVFESSLFGMLPYLDAIVVGLLGTYGFVLMINQRLQGETMEARERLELIFNTGPDAAMISRLPDGRIASVNDAFSELFGYARDEVVGRTTPEVHIWAHPHEREAVLHDLAATGVCSNREVVLMTKGGARVTAILSAKRLFLNGEPHVISVARDITDYKAALAEVTALSGMLPICMHCKQIRNDAGYWEQIEAYISSRSEAQFSHGICPTCMAKHYPEARRSGQG